MRLLALALAVGILAGCSSGGTPHAGPAAPGESAPAPADDLASHTPTDLRHPCRAVPARAAGRALGEKVKARKVTNPLAARTLACSYVARDHRPDAPSLEIRSTPDPTPLDSLVGLYLGVDRLPHHPVDVPGADDAEVILQPDEGLVTVFAKQGFVTHSVVLGLDDLVRGELAAVRLARLVVQANR